MDFDQALEEIGEFGKYQIYNYLLLCFPVFFMAGNSLTYVFTAGVPNYRCYIPGCDNETNPQYSEPWLKAAIPVEESDSDDSAYVPSQCSRYEPRNISVFECSNDDFTETQIPCDSWIFEDDEWTIVGEWNITCLENQWKLSLVGTMHFVGILVGTIISGFFADRYGRKIVFVFCILLMSVTGIAQAISSDYITFQVFVFINAVGTSGVYPLAFILGVELVGRRKREMSGIVLNYFYAVGEASIGLVAWSSKNWKVVQLAVSIPPILCIFYYWLVPESVRWLLANNKIEKANAIIKKAAKVNGAKLSSQLLFKLERGNETATPGQTSKTVVEDPSIWKSCKKLVRSKSMCFRALILFYIWAACAFVFYGLSVNSTSLGGNKYLNFALVCLVEIPGYTLSWWAMNKLGRRWSLASSLMLCATTCIGAVFVPQDLHVAVIILFLFGKLGITASFGIIYVYTAELYPTIMRSIGVGASSTMARLGAVVAPFAPLLAVYNKSLPLMIFSGASLLASVSVLVLPETLGIKLPDTIEEAERLKLYKKSKKLEAKSTHL